jgi:hypothetical protein
VRESDGYVLLLADVACRNVEALAWFLFDALDARDPLDGPVMVDTSAVTSMSGCVIEVLRRAVADGSKSGAIRLLAVAGGPGHLALSAAHVMVTTITS